MKRWKVVIKYNDVTFEIKIEADSFSAAFTKAEEAYPGCMVKSVSEIRSYMPGTL